MKAQHLLLTCASIVAAVASSSFAWAALSCDDAADVDENGQSDLTPCRRYSDNQVLGSGQVIGDIPNVRWDNDGRDLTVFGFNSQGDYIDGCFAQVIKDVTERREFGPICSQTVASFTILGKDIFTP
jgi:hypothetical protein